MSRKELPIEYLMECFEPDFDKGLLYWKVRPLSHFKDQTAMKKWNTRYSKTRAGNIYTRSSGYQSYQVGIQDQSYLIHRIIWALWSGSWAEGDVAHKNGDSLDDRIINLSDEEHAENMRYQKLKKQNKSGVNGVYWNESKQCWILSITRRQGIIRPYLTQSKDLFEAVCARKSFEIMNGFHPNHGMQH